MSADKRRRALHDRLGGPETGVQQLVLEGHEFLVSGLDFSPGREATGVGGSRLVRVWALDLDELIRVARRELTRVLSEDECRQ